MPYRKKLIEVSLPLDAINKESAREKSIRHGHPSTLHLWWARRPLAACRAVLWSSLVDDPSEYMPDEAAANAERERLFAILEELVKWENINNEEVLDKARLEIARSVARDLGVDAPVGKTAIRKFLAEQAPPVLDPFAGGGSIPLEAQRLGLRAYASDLNPVAVLINKALIEIPPKFAGMPPVHPPEEGNKGNGGKGKQTSYWKKEWKGAEGLAEDVHYYGRWMRDEAEKRIGHLYPKYKITEELLAERSDLRQQGIKPGDELAVIAWLWARTVKCPNPACGVKIPLYRSNILSKKKGRETWAVPNINTNLSLPTIDFKISRDEPTSKTSKVGRGSQFICPVCGQIATGDYIKAEGIENRLGYQLMAVVAEGASARVYFSPKSQDSYITFREIITWKPEYELTDDRRNIWCTLYGLNSFDKLFMRRQLIALGTISNLIKETREIIKQDASKATSGFLGNPESYANAITTFLAFALDKLTDLANVLCVWEPIAECPRNLFARQAIPMQWNFAEGNPLGSSSGSWSVIIENLYRNLLASLPMLDDPIEGSVNLADAKARNYSGFMISTDPPYYDNIGYAVLSDFFYVWLRHTLSEIYPDLFKTMLVPKQQELIAASYRFNGENEKAKSFFEEGLTKVFHNMASSNLANFPVTVFYAFKQAEEDDNEDDLIRSRDNSRSSTGWETMLEGLLSSDLMITGTWPIRTEMITALKRGFNNLASSIVLSCRPRYDNVYTATRREFLSALKRELPPALRQLQLGNIAPVDLAQAAIGPGMAIFSRYKAVLESDGSPMRVRAALALINQALDEYLAEQEGEYDADTRWALAWYEQYGHDSGPYGVAETLSKAKNTSVEGLAHAGFLEARAGKVRLLRRDELDEDWDPAKDKRLTAWEAAQHLIRVLDKDGEAGAGALLEKLGVIGEMVRDLAYRLYTVCERKGWAQEALAYNMLVVAWPRIKEQVRKGPHQASLL